MRKETLTFQAKFVRCSDAIGGEILQVCFDSVPESQDEDDRSTPYVLISRDFEYPGSTTIEWHDGHNYDGGAEIVSMTLSRDRVSIKLDRELDFDVGFGISGGKFAKLKSFLRAMIGDRVSYADNLRLRRRRVDCGKR